MYIHEGLVSASITTQYNEVSLVTLSVVGPILLRWALPACGRCHT